MPNNDNNNKNKGNIPEFFGGKDKKNGGKPKFSWSLFYIVITVALIGVYFFSANDASREVNDMEFYQMVKNQDIEHVEYVKKNSHINIFLKRDALESNPSHEAVKKNVEGPQYFLVVTDLQVYNENLRGVKEQCVEERLAADSTLKANDIAREYDFPMKQDNTQNWGFELIFWTLPILLIFLLYYFSMRSMRGGGGIGGA